MKFVIGVDGSIHYSDEVKQNDEIRQKQLEQEGLVFLRVSNEQITLNSEEVIHHIETFLKTKLQNK